MLTRRWLLILALLVVVGVVIPPVASAEESDSVRVLLFWDESCPNCETVMHEVLPPLEREYGDKLDIVLAEISALPAYDLFIASVERFDIPADHQGVPLLVIGDRALIGSEEIANGLPSSIEEQLSGGSPEVLEELGLTPELGEALNADSAAVIEGREATAEAVSRQTANPDPVANTAALAVLSLMGLSLAYVGARVGTRPRGTLLAAIGETRRRQPLMIPILAVLGMAVAGYLSYVELSGAASICPIGRCDVVQHSPYSELAGIPVAVLGFLAYAAILAMWAWGEFARGVLSRATPIGIFALSLFGTLFSAYLTYLEPFVIKAVCIWCLSSAVVITALLLVAFSTVVAEGAGKDSLSRHRAA